MTLSAPEPRSQQAKTKPVPRNGVDVPTLFATINAVKEQPELGKFQFRATNRWVRGTHSRCTIDSFSGASAEHMHKRELVFDADHPQVLVGADQGATPVEYLLVGLASCLMAGIGNIAAARGIDLEEITATIKGDIDIRGLLGISDDVRNGYQGIVVSFDVKGNAPEDKLRAIVEQSRARSAVFDVLTNGVPVTVEVNAN